MRKINILNKEGFLSDEDRKQPFHHGCSYFTFKTNLDLSEPVKVIPFDSSPFYSVEAYSRDVASFISYWNHFVAKDLNGFSGFSHVNFELVGFQLK